MPNFVQMGDGELAASVADPAHGSEAFRALYDRYAANVLAYAKARFPGHAEDVSQETWVRALRTLNKGGAAMTNLKAWLFTVAHNLGTNYHRGVKTAPLGDTDDAADRTPGVPEQMLKTEREAVMARCFEQLNASRPEYAAVVRAALAGERPEEAAPRLGISRDNFDKRKQRAIEALQTCVQGKLP